MSNNNAIVDDSLAFLYKAAASRAPGKRPVRVVSRERLVANFGDIGLSDDEDDADFTVEDASEDESDDDDSQGGDEQKGSDDEESDNSNAEDDEEEEEDSKESDGGEHTTTSQNLYSGLTTIDNTPDESNLGACLPPASDAICCICLNMKTSNDEIVQCDLCGLTVHEGCYGVVDTPTEDGSESSSESTEPWFCEPCLAGHNPGHVFCELCPNIGGAYKRTDTGRWVHLLCAFYNSNVTFGDTERLSAVCLSGVTPVQYGARSCSLCTNKLLSRTGVAVKCDAGMCKIYMHVTCGQKHGLLVDSLLNAGADDNSPEQNSIADPYYLCCSAHSERSAMKLKKHLYTKMDSQLIRFAPKNLTEREMQTLQLKRERFNDYFGRKISSTSVDDVAISGSIEKQQRLMTSSFEFMSKMKKKSELCLNITEEQWENEFRIGFTPDMVGKYVMPVAFAADFVSYYYEREKFIPSVGVQVKKLTAINQKLKNAQENIKEKFDTADKNYKTLTNDIETKYERLKTWCSVLKKYNCKNVKLLESPSFKIKTRQSSPPAHHNLNPSSSSATKNLTLNSSPKKMAVDTKENVKNKSKSPANITTPTKKIPGKFPATLLSSPTSVKNLECATCRKSNDQHRLAHCDTCKLHYHLTCLDPPLTKMPRKTAAYGWECSNCSRQSSDTSDDEKEPDVNAPRQLRTSHKPVQRYIAENSHDATSSVGAIRKQMPKSDKPKIAVKLSAEEKQEVEASPSKPNVADDIVADVMKRVFSSKSDDDRTRKNGVVNKNTSPVVAKRRSSMNAYELGALKKQRLLKPGVGTALHSPPISMQSSGLDDESSDDADGEFDDDDDGTAGQSCYETESQSLSPPKKRMQYQKVALTRAIDAVFTGEMGAKRASQVFGVPRSTIGRRIRQLKTASQSSSTLSTSNDVDDSQAVHVIRVEDLE